MKIAEPLATCVHPSSMTPSTQAAELEQKVTSNHCSDGAGADRQAPSPRIQQDMTRTQSSSMARQVVRDPRTCSLGSPITEIAERMNCNEKKPSSMFSLRHRARESYYPYWAQNVSSPEPVDHLHPVHSFRKELHVVIMFLIATLGVYVQILYQSTRNSLFDEHATIMAVILVSLCLYALSVIAEFALQVEPYLAITETFGPLFGFLVIALLLIILFPFLGTTASIILGLFVVRALIKSHQDILQALMNLCAAAHSAWSDWLRNNMHREGDGINDDLPA